MIITDQYLLFQYLAIDEYKQFGFRKKQSTTDAVNYSVNHLLNEIESRQNVVRIFIDLSKAFDTINHKI